VESRREGREETEGKTRGEREKMKKR